MCGEKLRTGPLTQGSRDGCILGSESRGMLAKGWLGNVGGDMGEQRASPRDSPVGSAAALGCPEDGPKAAAPLPDSSCVCNDSPS